MVQSDPPPKSHGGRLSNLPALGSGIAHVIKIPEQTDKFTERAERESVLLVVIHGRLQDRKLWLSN